MTPKSWPVGTVLVHPADQLDDPFARRIICRAVAIPGEWPWVRLSGPARELPSQQDHQELTRWQRTRLRDLEEVFSCE